MTGARPRAQRAWLRWVLHALAFAGFVISLYLTFVRYRGNVSPC